jgi:hypothetical protein
VKLAAALAVIAIFNQGETLDYNLHWTTIAGGSARMTIAPLNGERYRLTSVGKSGRFFSRFFRVRDEIDSVVDRTSFSTLQYHKILDERGKKKDELTVIDEGVATRKGKTLKVPNPIYDPLSLIYHLRSLELVPGKSHEFTVIADGKLYTLHANVLERETITTPAGKFNTVVVEPRMESAAGIFRDDQNRLLIWYSDDERHVPVRIRSEVNFGSITATLRSIKPGVASTEPTTLRSQ